MSETIRGQKVFAESGRVDRAHRPYSRTTAWIVTGAAVLALAACTGPDGPASPGLSTAGASSQPFESASAAVSPEQAAAEQLVQQAAASLLALGESSHGGLRFQSQIQAPNYQTDRDVGAAGVGAELIALAQRYPNDDRYEQAARRTATWLLAVSRQDSHGRYWPDYANDGDTSPSRYTSFDDGTIGIGDFFWRLYELTHDDQYKAVALQSVRWTLAQAEPYVGGYRWQWDAADNGSPYFMGMGQGAVGLADTLATFYARTKDSDPAFATECKRYSEGALSYIKSARQAVSRNGGDARALPETGVIGEDGDTAMNAGYLSGAAGAASMYLNLYRIFGNGLYLREAEELLGWLNDTAGGPKVSMGDGAAWKLMLDPQGGDDTQYATGIEEGAAGIGRTFLQAYRITNRTEYLQTARQAGNWLLAVALRSPDGGLSWREDGHPASPYQHVNLNNGAAGIGAYLYDLSQATNDPRYLSAAQGVQVMLATTTVKDGGTVFWQDVDDGVPYSRDPSWHWGSAGILEFLTRMAGNR